MSIVNLGVMESISLMLNKVCTCSLAYSMFKFVLGIRRVNFVKKLSFPTYPHIEFITLLDLLPHWVTNISLNLYQPQTLV